MPYGARWRTRRRLCHEVLNVRLTPSFDSHQYKYALHLLSRLLEAPECFLQEAELYVVSYPLRPNRLLIHLLILNRSMPGAAILSTTYGIDVKSIVDPFLNASLEASHTIAAAFVPGKFLVDTIPIRAFPRIQVVTYR